MRRLVLSVCLGLGIVGHLALAQQEVDLGESARRANQALAAVREAYEGADYSQAILLLDRLLDELGGGVPGTLPVEVERIQVEALRLRGISYYNLGQADAAETDWQRLLRLDPEHQLNTQLLSPKIVSAFEKVRQKVTGLLVVKSDPPGSRVFLGESAVGATPLEGLRIAAGRYLLRVEKRGYATSEQSIEVEAGKSRLVDVKLMRTARKISVMTLPAGARVLVDGNEIGVTSGAPPAGYHAGLVERGLDPSRASAPLVVPLLQEGRHTIRVEKDCHSPVEAIFNVDLVGGELPMELEPVVLERSVGAARFFSNPPGADVYLDGDRRGTAPLELRDLCAGTVQVRMSHPEAGAWMGEVEVMAGSQVEVTGDLRPTLVSLGAVRSLGQDEPDADVWDEFLANVVRLQTAYNAVLAHSKGKDPDAARLELYARIQADPGGAPSLSPASRRALEDAYQADLFLVAVPGREAHGAVVLLYGLNQGRPDVLNPSDPGKDSIETLVQRLSAPVRLLAPWSGLMTVDTAEVSFPFVYALSPSAPPGATVRAGDRIRSVAGRPVVSRHDLESASAEYTAGEKIPVSVQRDGAVRSAELVIAQTPVLPRPGDPELLVNKVLADLGSLQARTDDARIRNLAALVAGIAYLKAGESELALNRGFEKASLPADGTGISGGTVAYLKGLAMEAGGRPTQETRPVFALAASARGATVWRDDGPLVAPLAAARLAESR